MMTGTRLNGVIKAFETGQTAFGTFVPPEILDVQTVSAAAYDGIIFEMEHNPYDITKLQHALQYMLNRRDLAESGSLAPRVTPMVRVPVNGAEMSQWIAKQVLDLGVYGIIWPHVCTVEQARAAVAACRYARPKNAPNYDPPGQRGDGPRVAARYWGVTQAEYYRKADVWPIDPEGEILVGMMCEKVEAMENLEDILKQVPGIGLVIIGEGDLSQNMGYPRQYDHPEVVAAMTRIRETCHRFNVACGHPHVDTRNIEDVLAKGYRWVQTAPVTTFPALELGRKLAGR
jgi:4-hydroxy-2-oxoheptanedioate aldolase